MLSKGIPNKIKVTTITFKKIVIIKILMDNYIAILIKFDNACQCLMVRKFVLLILNLLLFINFSHFPCYCSGCSSSIEVLTHKATFLT